MLEEARGGVREGWKWVLEIAVGKGCERGGVREGRRWVLEIAVGEGC